MSFSAGKSTSSIFPSQNVISEMIFSGAPKAHIQNSDNVSSLHQNCLSLNSTTSSAVNPDVEAASTASTTPGSTPNSGLPPKSLNLDKLPPAALAFFKLLMNPVPPLTKTGLEVLSDLLVDNPTAESAQQAVLWRMIAHLRFKEKFEKKEKALKDNKLHWKNAAKRGTILLETMFQSHRSPGKLDMKVLAMQLKWNYKKVSNWFSKRRQAADREKKRMELERQTIKRNADLLRAQFSITSFAFFQKIANKMPLNLPYDEMQRVALLMNQCITLPEFFQYAFKLPTTDLTGMDMEVERELAQFEMQDDDVEEAADSQ